MKTLYAAIAVGLVSGVAAAATVIHLQQPEPEAAVVDQDFDADAATSDRVRALEMAVSEERRVRQLLEDELLQMMARVEELEEGLESENLDAELADRERNRRGMREFVEADESTVAERMAARRQALIDAGIDVGRADWILQREGELQFAAMRARYDAQNGEVNEDWASVRWNPSAMLRQEIGDAEYETYLEANGMPTSVGISEVMPSTPAASAGLQPGDQIVRYDGERVFSSFDLVQRTMSGGDEGQVVVDVERNGTTIQVVVPRGPIGVQIGSRGRRFPGS
ncbi:MAG: PDZ domain-containing protein [Pseudomonadota bacterium]